MNILIFMTFFTLAVFAAPLSKLSGNIILQNSSLELDWSGPTKGTVVVFLSAVCPCSNSHISYLKKLKSEFPDYKFVGVHSNVDEDEKSTYEYFKAAALNFEVIQDKKSQLANQLGAYKTPHSFLVSKDGNVLYQGGVTSSSNPAKADEFYLSDALKSHQQNVEIKVSKTRVLGCEISRN